MCGPWTVFFPQRSPPAEIGTKDTDSQEIIFAGANDLVTAASRPSLHSDSPISTSTPALIVLPGLETRWIFLKPSLSLRSWSQNPRVFFFKNAMGRGKKIAELIWDNEAWIRSCSQGSITSIILFWWLILLKVIRLADYLVYRVVGVLCVLCVVCLLSARHWDGDVCPSQAPALGHPRGIWAA